MPNKIENNKKLFGTSGIRGEIKDEVTCDLALNVGKALATYLNGHGEVVVGYDPRTSNQMLENAITAGLLESGGNVLKIGMVPTPVVGYAVEKLNASAGIMITASHNPSQYNGIKIWNQNGMAYTSSQENEIENIYYSKKFIKSDWNDIGTIHYIDEIKKEYINDLLNTVEIKPGLKVVIDSASGAGSEISPLVFRMAGCEVITLNSQIDGFFPGRNPEPNEANLQDLMKIVKATNSDIGIAHDGDADRMMAIDENGRIGDFDKLLALLSQYMAEKSNKNNDIKVVTTVDAGLCMDEALTSVNGTIVRTKVGDVNVAESIIEEKAIFGGEPSGTWLHSDFCMCPDGILSGLRIAEIVSKKGPLSKLLDDIPKYPNIREKISCSKEEKITVMENMGNLLTSSFEDIVDINTIDGVRITWDDGSWVLVRPSGTEDYIRITLESKTIEKANFIRDRCVEIININLDK
ncbi:putative phosphoglucosamine mutase [Candidatus Methanobinarius endosymbioticus]|uniref:Probable phosphoglucosamine mutase n=1 Tax=Candidatus Methanobinarius endosymbioticus TaxID=2006182 RepID=A0A366MCW9_9EURY|nr:putative phosphoglucosamine mutase [Candidatus Methanobinarius endosymbioticus]